MDWPDYLFFVVFLLISLGIGVYHAFTGGKQKTAMEFILADRQLAVLPTTLSMLVSFQSALAILGYAAEMYTRGSQALVLYCLMYTVAIILNERLFVPWLYPLKITSINEYFQLRYGSRLVRMLASAIGILWQVMYMGTAIFGPSAALEEATDVPLAVSVPVMASVCTIYTALGGMRAVIWTDVFQFLIMKAGMMTILIKGVVSVGGAREVIRQCSDNGRLIWADINPDPRTRHTIWGFLFGFTSIWCCNYGFNQASFQRYSATKSLKQAKLTLLLNLPILYLMTAISCFTGLVVFAFYAKLQCDPLDSNQISNSNQILPHFVVLVFNKVPVFQGLFLAMLYSGALSSVSSSLSGAAANCWEDICKSFKVFSSFSEQGAAKVNKILVVLFGISATGLAFLAMLMPGPLTQIAGTFGGACGGPLFGLFLFSGTSRIANWQGASTGLLVGFACNLWLSTGSIWYKHCLEPALPGVGIANCSISNSTAFPNSLNTTDIEQETCNITGIKHLYTLSYVWLPLIGSVVTWMTGLIVSIVSGCKEDGVIPLEYFIDYSNILPFKRLCIPEKDKVQVSLDEKPKSLECNSDTQASLLNTKL